VRVIAAYLVALLTYPVAGWLVRVFLTALTSPLSRLGRITQSRRILNLLRTAGGAACGLGGWFAAAWVMGRFGRAPSLVLAGILIGAVAVTHVLGARRLAGGPQFAGEFFSLAGEELGLIAGVVVSLRA
jgi:hypothetical protein